MSTTEENTIQPLSDRGNFHPDNPCDLCGGSKGRKGRYCETCANKKVIERRLNKTMPYLCPTCGYTIKRTSVYLHERSQRHLRAVEKANWKDVAESQVVDQ